MATLNQPADGAARAGRRKVLWLGLGVGVFGFLLPVALWMKTGTPVDMFTRDLAEMVSVWPLLAAQSSLGVMLWAATVAVCGFCWTLLGMHGEPAPMRGLFLSGGLLTLLLCLDDAFMIHEQLVPASLGHLGVSEKVVLGGYVVLAGVFFAVNLKALRAGPWGAMLAALICFMGSLVVDVVEGNFTGETARRWVIVVEEALKFAGIGFWLLFFARYGLEVCAAVREP